MTLEGERRDQLAYRCREIEALALRGDPAAATAHARRHIQPWMSLLDAKTQRLADDLLVALSGRFRTR